MNLVAFIFCVLCALVAFEEDRQFFLGWFACASLFYGLETLKERFDRKPLL